jgi:hypothetical protein
MKWIKTKYLPLDDLFSDEFIKGEMSYFIRRQAWC